VSEAGEGGCVPKVQRGGRRELQSVKRATASEAGDAVSVDGKGGIQDCTQVPPHTLKVPTLFKGGGGGGGGGGVGGGGGGGGWGGGGGLFGGGGGGLGVWGGWGGGGGGGGGGVGVFVFGGGLFLVWWGGEERF